MQHYKYLIVGGGLAAGYAAQTIAEHSTQGASSHGGSELAILSADTQLPYERPALSKEFLAGQESADDILINEPDFYAENGIDVHLETRVTAINFDEQTVAAGDARFGYDNLLLATGARAKPLPIEGFDLAGVHTLHLMHDSKAIRADMEDARRAVVIGGSFIGMEVASVLQDRGIQTTLAFPEDRVWASFFTPEMSRYFEDYYREQGVTFVTSAEIARLEGADGRVTGVVLTSGRTLPADLVVAGVGVKPNVDAVSGGPLHLEDGILVNRFLETNIRNVFAAGDVARYRDPRTGELRRIEHWDNAKSQGQHAARGMLGMREEFRHVPYFFSDVFDLSYEFWGDAGAAHQAIHRGEIDSGSFSTWWLDQENRLVAAFVMDRPDEERELALEWIRHGTPLDPGLVETSDSLSGAALILEPQT